MLTKNEQIAETMRMTYERRRHQTCRVIELKVNRNRLNKEQKETMKMMFVEAKWCFNYILDKMDSKEIDVFDLDPKSLVNITHKDKDKNDVDVTLRYLKSSLKVAVVDGIM